MAETPVCIVTVNGQSVSVQFPQSMDREDRAYIVACIMRASDTELKDVLELYERLQSSRVTDKVAVEAPLVIQ